MAERIELDERSWIDVHRGHLAGADALFDELRETAPWRQTKVFRYDHWRDENRLTASYRLADMPEPLKDVTRFLQQTYRVTFDSVALNWYRDGNDGQAFHRDTDLKWLDETVIAILTLGAERPWLVRPRSARNDHGLDNKGAVIDLSPRSGDLHVMGGATQQGWEHSVQPIRRPVAGRISAQWRWTSRRGRQFRGASYSAPLHYGR